MHATGPHSACVVPQAHPTMSCIHLASIVYVCVYTDQLQQRNIGLQDTMQLNSPNIYPPPHTSFRVRSREMQQVCDLPRTD